MKKLALALMVTAGFAWAGDASTAFDAGMDFGQQQKGGLKGNITTDGAQKNIPNYTTSTQETTLFNSGQGSLIGPGSAKLNKCATGPKADSNYNQQECDAVNFLAKNPQQRPQINIDKNDQLITGSTQIINAAKSSGGFSGCKNTIVTKPAIYEDAICHEGNKFDQVSCSKILNVVCQPPSDGCDAGGVLVNSLMGSAVYVKSFENGDHTVTVKSPGRWSGKTTYAVDLKFTIQDIGKLSVFKLVDFTYDDWLLISVNGVNVYIGPKGGTKLTAGPVTTKETVCTGDSGNCRDRYETNYYVNNGIGNYAYEQSGDGSGAPNMDIKPYLHDGLNTIHFFNVSGGDYGYMNVRFRFREICPIQCDDVWDNQCSPYEARMQ